LASDPNANIFTPSPATPGDIGPADLASPNLNGAPGTAVYPVALPVDAGNGQAPLLDSSGHRKFYTISAEIRESYDSNVTTSNSSTQKASFETTLGPDFLVTAPVLGGSFSGRYSPNLTYYSGSNQGGGGNSNNSIEVTHELIASYSHSFNDRFSMNVDDQFRYFTEPSIYESTGTFYRDGAYVSNTFDGLFAAQVTPLIGSTTSYTNTIVRYDQSSVAQAQNNVQNTGSESVSVTILPTVSVSAGAVLDEVDYTDNRGYLNLSLFGGASWQPSEQLSLSGRAGISYTDTNGTTDLNGAPNGNTSLQSQTTISPYAALTVSYKTSSKTNISFDYSHDISPTDQAGADAETVDRVSASGAYNVTKDFKASAQAILNHLSVSAPELSYTENDYGIAVYLSYQLNSHYDLTGAVSYTGVASELEGRNYARDTVSIGIRGTY
jgi:Putative beta-barrel porin 2